ncbi:MAG: ATP-dependent DNA helicase RecG [Candidatus Omnitrophica bacterium]|nr:ATP-dependent DNA helicase RecG [Candidatus Omnitrophota bacterium]
MFSIEVQYLKGVGPKRAKLLKSLGINSVEDLLYYFPRRYEERTHFSSIAELKEAETRNIKAEILTVRERKFFRRRRFTITEAVVADATGKITCVWFNQGYLKDYLKVGTTLILYGKIERYGTRLQMSSPEFEMVSEGGDESLNVGRIVPIYSLPEGITQRYFRELVKYALDEYVAKANDFLPFNIRSKCNLLNLAKSLINIHFPESLELQKEAYTRLSFEEFFLFELPLVLRKIEKREKPGVAHKIDAGLVEDFIRSLPFELTLAQKKVIEEIKSDMAGPKPMQRLLQGDVGSGKTIVATIAGVIAMQGGYQVAFMVPTEILAKQHFEKVSRQLAAVTRGAKPVRLGLLTSSANKKDKEKIYQELKDGEIDLLIGTHALLEEQVSFKKLGLVVIDEQHKFGVGQRALLPSKGPNPDILIMTATPIPRTLAITLYADLDVSIINELPPGRQPIKTIQFSQKEISDAYEIAKGELKLGHQVYIIYPVIEESYVLDIAGAKKMFDALRKGEFSEFKLGLIHGKLKQGQQDEAMQKFKEKKLDLLVATTVLEVGIDIANATCMLIENAQRFGLAQLHQLRGRVGRGALESFCLLVSDTASPDAKLRLDAMVKYGDGFRIAEEDLRIRGPGEFFGKRQHGLAELKIANPLTQMQLLKKAREEAIRLLNSDPQLKMRPNALLKEKLLQRFPEYQKLMIVG